MGARTIAARLHGTSAPGVPRWAVRTGYAITLAVLPSCLWRIGGFIVGLPLLDHGPTPAERDPAPFDGGWAYILALSVVSEALALLCFGLVARWGEVWPGSSPTAGRPSCSGSATCRWPPGGRSSPCSPCTTTVGAGRVEPLRGGRGQSVAGARSGAPPGRSATTSVAARTKARTRAVVLLSSQTGPRSIGGASWIGTYATSGRG